MILTKHCDHCNNNSRGRLTHREAKQIPKGHTVIKCQGPRLDVENMFWDHNHERLQLKLT